MKIQKLILNDIYFFLNFNDSATKNTRQEPVSNNKLVTVN